jgi:HEAT repeat protein
MAQRSRRRSLEDKLAAVRELGQDPRSEAAASELRRALGDKNWLVVSEAATVIGEHALHAHRDQLLEVWPRFAAKGNKTDPGCRAKEAALAALDSLELLDPEPFLAAIRYQQFEPVAGGKVDTAGGVRLRALAALVRLLHADATLYAGELLADPDPQVRVGVARLLGQSGARGLAGLLVYKLRAGDEDPTVLSESASSLLALAPDFGTPLLGSLLAQGSEVMRATAALALGQSNREAMVAVLIAWLEGATWDGDFELGVRALGLSRLEPAREFLLGVVGRSSLGRARLAIQALAIHSYDRTLHDRVRAAADRSQHAQLSQEIDRAFASSR